MQERTRYDVRLSQCKLWAGARQCLASDRSYPPLGPPSPQASPPCPRSQGHSPQVKSALFVFVFQGVGPPHAHSGWLFLAFASLRAAYGRRAETWTPVVIGRLYAPCSKAKAPNSGDISPLGRPGDCLMDKGFRAVDNCKRKGAHSTQPRPLQLASGGGGGEARAPFTYFIRGQTEGVRV